ncbi:outer membrane protein assembly factor BamB family protein [Streptomyces coffeae]|uniref:PQQ-binding-like beta-propeller repeat protein n=1 Tax=Streptomyces coffeae TaxID=621382 RepID=A0ABS1NQH8_9ACTN|nr:PQQ-binding-like beta-propeller repeat protein [Streptomyces coffeae]MBL1102346.1 PQQ-binding-like beta-propeller repeat protein [Streptomyces coffeae]
MEPLTTDDPRRLGSYHLIARLTQGTGEVTVTARQFVARSAGGARTVVLTTPLSEAADDPAHRGRFLAEAERARLLAGSHPPGWLAPVVELAGDPTEPPWSASPYLPMLPLPAALEAHGGPLPAATVRALGAALTETLAGIHATGTPHAGIAPDTVFVAGDGPRLAGFGAVRAAGPDGEIRADLPGVSLAVLPPEQLSGGRPRPLGDVFSLGAVLAYAVTGRLGPDVDTLPEELRDTLGACLAPDPADRPTAQALLDELARGLRSPVNTPSVSSGPDAADVGVPGSSPGVSVLPAGWSATVRDSGGVSPAAALLGRGWLPGRVIAALSEQSSAVLDAEVDSAREPSPEPADGRATRRDDEELSQSIGPSRRGLLVGAVCGTAGVAVGAGVTWTATAPDDPPPPTPAERLAAAHRSHRRLEGAPPQPRWRHDVTGAAPAYAPLIWRGRVVVLTGKTAVHGIDLRTGKQLWTRDGLRPAGAPWAVDAETLFVPGDGLVALDALTGRVRWRSKDYRRGAQTLLGHVLAVDRSTVWFTVTVGAEDGGDRHAAIAFDVDTRREAWRRTLPAGFTDGHLLKDVLVAMDGGGEGGGQAIAFARESGKRLWQRVYRGIGTKGFVTSDGNSTLIAAVASTLRGFDPLHGSRSGWSLRSLGKDAKGHLTDFGLPYVHGKTAYVADGGYALHAVEARTGKVRWQRAYGFALETEAAPTTPDTLVSPSGRRLLMASDTEVDAFDTTDGSLLWRFTDIAGGGPRPRRRTVALTDDTVVVVDGRGVYALPMD